MGDKINKLSTAIRVGAMIRPQVIRSFFGASSERVVNEFGMKVNVLGSCAIGAALEATGLVGKPEDYTAWCKKPKALGEILSKLVERFNLSDGLINHIITMNDEAGLTREQIADEVELQGW